MIREASALLYGMEKQAKTHTSFATYSSDIQLLKLLQSRDDYSLKIFRGGGKRYGLIVRDCTIH
jgi:hypothetical protein